jgi:hypothetical protein
MLKGINPRISADSISCSFNVEGKSVLVLIMGLIAAELARVTALQAFKSGMGHRTIVLADG